MTVLSGSACIINFLFECIKFDHIMIEANGSATRELPEKLQGSNLQKRYAMPLNNSTRNIWNSSKCEELMCIKRSIFTVALLGEGLNPGCSAGIVVPRQLQMLLVT